MFFSEMYLSVAFPYYRKNLRKVEMPFVFKLREVFISDLT